MRGSTPHTRAWKDSRALMFTFRKVQKTIDLSATRASLPSHDEIEVVEDVEGMEEEIEEIEDVEEIEDADVIEVIEKREVEEIGAILESLEGELERILEDESARPQPISARDVLEGRKRSNSFYEAPTERLPASLVIATPPANSLSPFVVARPEEALSTGREDVPTLAPEPLPARAPRPRAESPRPSSGPWLVALLAAAGCAAFLAFLEREMPRSAPPALAPPAAATAAPTRLAEVPEASAEVRDASATDAETDAP